MSFNIEKIKVFAFDVDGVITDGTFLLDSHGNELKSFNVKDGYIIKRLINAGLYVGAISGRASKAVETRAAELGFHFNFLKVKNKIEIALEIVKQYNLTLENMAYVGDDIPDIELIKKCGFSACPADASEHIKKEVDYVANAKGGKGVVREIGELILDKLNISII